MNLIHLVINHSKNTWKNRAKNVKLCYECAIHVDFYTNGSKYARIVHRWDTQKERERHFANFPEHNLHAQYVHLFTKLEYSMDYSSINRIIFPFSDFEFWWNSMKRLALKFPFCSHKMFDAIFEWFSRKCYSHTSNVYILVSFRNYNRIHIEWLRLFIAKRFGRNN